MFGGLMGALLGRNRKPAMGAAPASPAMPMMGAGVPATPAVPAEGSEFAEKKMPAGLDPAAMEPMKKEMPSDYGSMISGIMGGSGMGGVLKPQVMPGNGYGRMGGLGGMIGGGFMGGMQRPAMNPMMGVGTNVPGLRVGQQPSLKDALMMRKPMQPELEDASSPQA